MSPAPDLKRVQAYLDEIAKTKPHVRRLIEVLKTVCDDDPQFLMGAVHGVEEDEEDTQILIDWINEGEGVNYSSILGFSAELYQNRHPEKFNWESK